MAGSPSNSALTGANCGDTVIAQYLVTKVAWWATYPRIIIITPSTVSTYNPETFQCTNQWEIADIEGVEVQGTSNQFVLRLEKSHFRSAKLRFACSARGHLLSLLARLRRQVKGETFFYRVSNARRLHFRCIEQFANASHKLLFLQVMVSSIIFLDESGHRVQTLPFLYLKDVAFSSEHSDGMVLSTAFHDRFFLCGERHECMNEIIAAANEAGVQMYKKASKITALQLRLRNSQVLDRPSVIRFDVKKARVTTGNGDAAPGSDSSESGKKAYKKIQLILQGDAIVEMHRSMRTVIARPYNALLAIIRPDWDPRTLVLEFKQEDTLVLDMEGRDQLVTLLLLVCRETGHHDAVLTSSGLNYSRFYHPHIADGATGDSCTAAVSMGTFLLRRITQTSGDGTEPKRRSSFAWSPRRRRSSAPRTPRGSSSSPRSDSNERGGWFQRRVKERRIDSPSYETRNSIDSGLSMNDNVSITVAMEELNTNLPLDELARSGPGHADVVNKAMELVFEHLVTLVASLRRYGEATSNEVITTLQALVRLYHHPDASFVDDMIPRVFDALHELILQQDVLTCYWSLRLIQCFLGIRTPNTTANVNCAGDQRARTIDQFIHHGTIQHSIVDLIPASFAVSHTSSIIRDSSKVGAAFWMADPEACNVTPPSSLSSTQSSILCTKEARVQNEINVVFYETLQTLHHSLIHLKSAAKIQRATRDRQNYIAATSRQTHTRARGTSNASDDVPAGKQTDSLARKLLEKYRFLMDSIVDIRLVRMAETSAALVQFVLTHFANKPPAQSALSDNQQSHSQEENSNDMRRKRLGELGSFLDDYQAVAEHRAETRSLLFGAERTIEIPPQSIISERTDIAMERLLNPGMTNRLGTVLSNNTMNGTMRLEHLDPSEPSNSTREEVVYTKSLEQGNAFDTYDSLDPASHDDNQVSGPPLPLSVQRLVGLTSPVRSIRTDLGTNLLKSDDELDTNGIMFRSDHAKLTAPKSPNTFRKAFQTSMGTRRTTNECNACIGCNDVCSNEECFFCAEKEYQLQIAFGANPAVAAGPSVRRKDWKHRTPSVESNFNVEREYSSCELRRHHTLQSCWIRVDDNIYDVTDMLDTHPGGTKVLLETAKHGGDCGPILKTHPPEAREMLSKLRLGRYYECTK